MLFEAGSQPLAAVSQTRPVYLPAGVDWYDFWTGQKYAGGQTLQADAPISRLPLYVRAGSILPLGPVRQHVQDLPDAPLELHVYTGQDGSFELYEDEGDQYNYERGEFSTILIRWNDARRRLAFGMRAGQYAGMKVERNFEIVLHDEESHSHGVSQAGQSQTARYWGEPVVIEF
jgi:alpha-D-xyloside xylohydrolase